MGQFYGKFSRGLRTASGRRAPPPPAPGPHVRVRETALPFFSERWNFLVQARKKIFIQKFFSFKILMWMRTSWGGAAQGCWDAGERVQWCRDNFWGLKKKFFFTAWPRNFPAPTKKFWRVQKNAPRARRARTVTAGAPCAWEGARSNIFARVEPYLGRETHNSRPSRPLKRHNFSWRRPHFR